MNLQLIERFNESEYACQVKKVLEMDPENPQIATKIITENPKKENPGQFKNYDDIFGPSRDARNSGDELD
jgi:hypothetical protein